MSLPKDPAQILDRQKNLLAVLPDAERDEQREGRRFPVEPHGPTVPSRINRTIGSSASERAIPSIRPLPCANLRRLFQQAAPAVEP